MHTLERLVRSPQLMGRTVTQVKLQLITCQWFRSCVFFSFRFVLLQQQHRRLPLEPSRYFLLRVLMVVQKLIQSWVLKLKGFLFHIFTEESSCLYSIRNVYGAHVNKKFLQTVARSRVHFCVNKNTVFVARGSRYCAIVGGFLNLNLSCYLPESQSRYNLRSVSRSVLVSIPVCGS